MADEYIRKADAIGAIWHSIDGELFGELESCAHAVIGDADNAIESLEPADVVPVIHSHWTLVGWHKGMKVVECFKCKCRAIGSCNFCHNCGAKMDGGKED